MRTVVHRVKGRALHQRPPVARTRRHSSRRHRRRRRQPRRPRDLAEFYGKPFHHIPVTADTKADAEAATAGPGRRPRRRTCGARPLHADPVAGAVRRRCAARAINIHHSFLPSFKGARPYFQAHDRGVKLIGATAHYVTADLDEGPIIEQDVERVDHTLHPRVAHGDRRGRRAPRARPRRPVARRAPRAARRPPDHRLQVGPVGDDILDA